MVAAMPEQPSYSSKWITFDEVIALAGIPKEQIAVDIQQKKLAEGKWMPLIIDGRIQLHPNGRKVWAHHWWRPSVELYVSQWVRKALST